MPFGRVAWPDAMPGWSMLRDMLVAMCLVLASMAVALADEPVQDWIPEVLVMPEDAETLTDRAIGSTVRMFSIATSTDADALLQEWEESLAEGGYPVTQGSDDLLERSIEFSGPGITNAKIVLSPSTDDGRTVIEFDATLN